MKTLAQALSGSLKGIGFNRITTENQKGVRRSWWKGPRYEVKALSEIIQSDGLKVTGTLESPDREVFGPGWSLSFDSEEREWCLSLFKKNRYGTLERMGIDC